jgi:hypothetical protein
MKAALYALSIFFLIASLSINCHLGLFECPGATGSAAVRS